MGTPDFAVPSLQILIENNYPIETVVTAPDKPRGRGQQLSPTPIKELALKHQLPILQPAALNDPAFVAALRAFKPDLIVVVAFRILPKEVFSIPRLGSFNLHASLLPKYRGAAPINWAIINGDTETGVTTFLLQEKVDTGNTLLQARVPIKPDDDAGTIHDKLAEVGAEIVLHTVRMIERGAAAPRQQDNIFASLAPKILKEDCRINWNQPATNVHNFVRGLSPYPTAFARHSGKVIKVYRTQIVQETPRAKPGTAMVTPVSLHVATAAGVVALKELQQEGRRRMSVEEFLRGYKVSSGDEFQ